MDKLFIKRSAADNKYLHRDFHESSDTGISYVGQKYGDQAVVEYLTRYSKAFYVPLVARVKENGLIELEKYFIDIFEKEEFIEYLRLNRTEKKLTVKIEKCPAVTAMKSLGHTPSKWYKETTYTVYGVLAESCGYDFEVAYYNEEDGKTEFTFSVRE